MEILCVTCLGSASGENEFGSMKIITFRLFAAKLYELLTCQVPRAAEWGVRGSIVIMACLRNNADPDTTLENVANLHNLVTLLTRLQNWGCLEWVLLGDGSGYCHETEEMKLFSLTMKQLSLSNMQLMRAWSGNLGSNVLHNSSKLSAFKHFDHVCFPHLLSIDR